MSYDTKKMAVYHRWALRHRERGFMIGRYCWQDGSTTEVPIRTFRTREDARKSRASLRCYRREAQVVKVYVIVEATP